MEITQAEFATYRPFTIAPDIGRRIRILSCVHNERPIIHFTLYEGTVDAVDPLLNEITLLQGATEFVVIDRVNTANGPAPLTNGIIRFPFEFGDFNLYYWKYIEQPTEVDKEKRKKPFLSEREMIGLEKESLGKTAKRRLTFAGKRNKKTKVKRKKTLK